VKVSGISELANRGCSLGGKKAIFIDDLDDTLVHTTWRYEIAHLRACTVVLEYVGAHCPYMTQLVELRQNIDDDFVQKNGFSPGYYENALHAFLDEVCKIAGVPPNDSVKKQLSEISKYPFDVNNYCPENLIKGAEETLEFQAQEMFGLFMVTRGIPDVQKAKISNLGLYNFFSPDNVFVVPKNDKSVEWEKIAGGMDKSNIYIVEDSLMLVNKATALGFNAIFIPESRGAQKRENSFGKIKNPELTIPLECILEVKLQYGNYKNAVDRRKSGGLPAYILQYL